MRKKNLEKRISLLRTRRENAEKRQKDSTKNLKPIPDINEPIVLPIECDIFEKVKELPKPNLIDAFRYFYPNVINAYTCWDIVRSLRKVNKGARIDVT